MIVGDRRTLETEFRTGGLYGLRLPDDEHWCAIEAGFDKCRLEKRAVRPDGTGTLVEERDLRGQPELQSANCGLIQFRNYRAGTGLKQSLATICDFLDSVEVPEITRMIV
jgi:hypothetical protein